MTGVSNDPNSTPNHNDPGDRQLPKSTTATATSSTSPSNRANFLDVGPAIRILTVNTEGLTYTKRVILASLCEEHGVDVLCLQETHIEDDAPTTRLKIANFDLLAFSGHNKHGRAIYIHKNIADAEKVGSSTFCDTIRVGKHLVTNVYKPPSASWNTAPLPPHPHPAIFVGDFNSHHTTWGYEESDENGNWLENWASLANLSLIIEFKQRGTFHSARWNRDYNPDLCWVSAHNGLPLPATITVLDDFPRSQHRPTLLHVGIRIPLLQSLQKPRWNFRKADWNKFAEILDKSTVCIPHNISLSEAYTRFQKAVFSAAKKSVPLRFGQELFFQACILGSQTVGQSADFYEVGCDFIVEDV